MTDMKPLKQIAIRMEDSTAKKLILSLPDDVDKKDLVIQFDLILQFLGTETQGVKGNDK